MSESNFIDDTLRGMATERCPAWDPLFVEDVIENLFDEQLDLAALNIQRGRDHGIRGMMLSCICIYSQNGMMLFK